MDDVCISRFSSVLMGSSFPSCDRLQSCIPVNFPGNFRWWESEVLNIQFMTLGCTQKLWELLPTKEKREVITSVRRPWGELCSISSCLPGHAPGISGHNKPLQRRVDCEGTRLQTLPFPRSFCLYVGLYTFDLLLDDFHRSRVTLMSFKSRPKTHS